MDIRTISANYYNVKNYGALGDGTTDDTAAIQGAINAAFAAHGGVVYFPIGTYVLGGSLVTSLNSVNPNCQLYIPLSTAGTTMARIKLLGEAPPNWASEVVSGSARNTYGVILKTTILGTGTTPAVIGTPWYADTYGDFNYTYVDLENIVVQTRTKTGSTHITPTMSGINFKNIVACTFKNVSVQTESNAIDLLTPSGSGTFGIRLPQHNNKAVCDLLETNKVEGFEYGIVVGEHASMFKIFAVGCIHGLYTESEGVTIVHSASIFHAALEGNRNNITTGGYLKLKIFNYSSEHDYDTSWHSFEKDLAGGGDGMITIFSASTTANGGGSGTDEFVVEAGMTYKCFSGAGAN